MQEGYFITKWMVWMFFIISRQTAVLELGGIDKNMFHVARAVAYSALNHWRYRGARDRGLKQFIPRMVANMVWLVTARTRARRRKHPTSNGQGSKMTQTRWT